MFAMMLFPTLAKADEVALPYCDILLFTFESAVPVDVETEFHVLPKLSDTFVPHALTAVCVEVEKSLIF